MKHLFTLLISIYSCTLLYAQDDSFFLKGINNVEHGDYKSAISCFNQEILQNPNNAETYYEIGKCYLKTNEPSKAIDSFQKCINIDPQCETYEWINTPYVLIGDVFASQGNTNKAIEYYKKSLSVFPQDKLASTKINDISNNSLPTNDDSFVNLTINYPNSCCKPYTNGQCFDLFFENCAWKYFKSNSGSDIVEFSGSAKQELLKPGMSLSCVFQYIIKNGKPEIGYLEINNEKQPIEFYDMFMLQTVMPLVIDKYISKPVPDKIK